MFKCNFRLHVVLIFAIFITGPVLNQAARADVESNASHSILFENLTRQISNWLAKHLNEANLDARLNLSAAKIAERTMVEKFNEAVAKTAVEFIPENKLSEECKKGDLIACELARSTRTCINSILKKARIVCNGDLYTKRVGDEQFVITFHEYLGIAGIETDKLDDLRVHFSQYPISRHLMKYAVPSSRLAIWQLLDQAPSSPISAKLSDYTAFVDPCLVISQLYVNELSPVTYFRCTKMNFSQAYIYHHVEDADVCLAISEKGKYVGIYGNYFYPIAVVNGDGYNAKGQMEGGSGLFWTRLRGREVNLQTFSTSTAVPDQFMAHYGITLHDYGEHYFDFPNQSHQVREQRAYEIEINHQSDWDLNKSFVYEPRRQYLDIERAGYRKRAKVHLENMKLSLEISGRQTSNIGQVSDLNCKLETQ